MKDSIDILITPITSITNLSFSEGSFLSHFKSSPVFIPILKNPTLKKDRMKNYLPVSNLSFLSKVHEKSVMNQLNSYINRSSTSNQYQFANRKLRSTESALLKIHNDIAASGNAGKITTLTLLDISAAFDTIDHSTLLRRLNEWFRALGKALNWFNSYLTGRCQRVK